MEANIFLFLRAFSYLRHIILEKLKRKAFLQARRQAQGASVSFVVEYSCREKLFRLLTMGEALFRYRNTIFSVVDGTRADVEDYLPIAFVCSQDEAYVFIHQFQSAHKLPVEERPSR